MHYRGGARSTAARREAKGDKQQKGLQLEEGIVEEEGSSLE